MNPAGQDQLYAYKVPHDHNFTFLTTGFRLGLRDRDL